MRESVLKSERILLAGDIGGTKIHLGVFTEERGLRRPLAEAVYRSAVFDGLEEVVHRFFAETGLRATEAVFGVAGPVLGETARITNLPWIIDGALLRKTLTMTDVSVVNDVEAIASFVPFLEQQDLFTLHPGIPLPHGTLAVIAPGTGLGEAFLTWDGKRYVAHPSEGGHADFSPTTEQESRLLSFLHERYGRVSCERVCSGSGILNLYRFLREQSPAKDPDRFSGQISEAADPVPVIVEKALDRETPCDICVETLDLFASILGAEAGNMALRVLATGGVYLGGGIPQRVLPFLEKAGFLERFLQKGRMRDLVSRIPVHVITNPKTALLGAAALGMRKK